MQKRGEKQEQDTDQNSTGPAGKDNSTSLNQPSSVGGYDSSGKVTSTDQSSRNTKTKSRTKVPPAEEIDSIPLREPLLDDLF